MANLYNYLEEILYELKRVCKFETEVTVEVASTGYYNKTSQDWFGLLKVLEDRKADLALNLMHYGDNREEVVDFLVPLFRTKRRFYLRKTVTMYVKWKSYFQVREEFILILHLVIN